MFTYHFETSADLATYLLQLAADRRARAARESNKQQKEYLRGEASGLSNAADIVRDSVLGEPAST